MTAEAQSLLTLLGLIFGSVAVFVIVLIWWVRRTLGDEQ